MKKVPQVPEHKAESSEIVLGSATLVLKPTGGRLIWDKTENKLSVNTKLFSHLEAAQMTGLREIGLRTGLQSVLQNGQNVLSDLKVNPELQRIFRWQGLKAVGRESDFEVSQSRNFPSAVMEFQNALEAYALTGQLPKNLSSEVSQAFQTLNKQLSQRKSGGNLDDFLKYLFSGKTKWKDRKNLFQNFLKPIETGLNDLDKQQGKTDSFTYQPPQSSNLSEEQEALPEEAIQTKVGPKFLGGYYRRRRCHFDPTQAQGIGRESLAKEAWTVEQPPIDEKVWETKRPYHGVFTPGQENMLPWNKDGLPLLDTLEPKNTFVVMRDSQGGISIEVKEGVNITEPTPFSFDFVLHKCESNTLADQPTDRDKKIEGGDLDPEMTEFINDLNAQNHLSDVHKGREIMNYIRTHFRYPNDEAEIAQIDGTYQSQMQSNLQGLWQKMSEVGVMHCYWANILRNELCHRVDVASAICEGPYVTKDPRWDFAVVEAPGLTKHAWGIVWDPANEEWTHDGQDATPPKAKSDEDDKESEARDTEPQDGDFAPSDPPEQLSEEELEKLYEELEKSSNQEDEEPDPTPEERAAEQFEREKGIEKSTWDAFKHKTEGWGRQLVSAQNSIDGRDSTLEQEDKKLTEMIKIRRQIPQNRFKGPVRKSKGIFLDEPVTAYVGSKSGDSDPVGWKNPQTHIREKVEVTVFEQDFIADLSGSMDSSGAVNPQHQMILQSLYYDWRRNQHLSHSQNREDMTTPLEWKSQVYSFGGFASNDLGVEEDLNEKKLCHLDQTLQEADGSSSAGMYQTLQAYKKSLTDEDKKFLREGKKIKMLTITTDGNIPDQGNCKKLVQELRELGVVVQGIGFGSGASNIHEVCREAEDSTSSVVLSEITQATQARSQKLKKVIQEQL
jgi:hypothetical protein